MTDNQEIGLIGIGLLGTALAHRLLHHDRLVVGFDICEGRRGVLASAGGFTCEASADVVRRCAVVLVSLPTSEVAASVFQEIRSHLRPGQVIIDTTTGDPARMIETGQSLSGIGVDYVESTVAGSSVQVQNGEATLFLGGPPDVVCHVEPLLSLIAQKHFHLGPAGSASRFKLVHNLILGLHRAVLAEGLTFAGALGFDLQMTLEILRQTPAASAVMPTKGPKMVHRDFVPQARLAQHQKDVRLMLAEAKTHGARLPLSDVHADLLQRAIELGFGDADNSAIIEAFCE